MRSFDRVGTHTSPRPKDTPAPPGCCRRQLTSVCVLTTTTNPPAGLASPNKTPARLPLRLPLPPPAPRAASCRLRAAMPPPSLLFLHSLAPLQPRPFRMSSPAAPCRVVVCSAASAEGFIPAAPILFPEGPWKQVSDGMARVGHRPERLWLGLG